MFSTDLILPLKVEYDKPLETYLLLYSQYHKQLQGNVFGSWLRNDFMFVEMKENELHEAKPQFDFYSFLRVTFYSILYCRKPKLWTMP